jgi:hypothetical protein
MDGLIDKGDKKCGAKVNKSVFRQKIGDCCVGFPPAILFFFFFGFLSALVACVAVIVVWKEQAPFSVARGRHVY